MNCANENCPWYSDYAVKDNCRYSSYVITGNEPNDSYLLFDRVEHCRNFIGAGPAIPKKIVEKEVIKPKTTNILSHILAEDLG